MRAGRNQSIAAPGDWLVALRGQRDNPVRGYLLACRRRRKLHFWQRPDLVLFITILMLVIIAALVTQDFSSIWQAGHGAGAKWAILVNIYQYAAGMVIGIPLLLWWMQGLFVWARDSLSLLSDDRDQPLALPLEIALLPLTDAELLLGAQAVLLPPVLLRTGVVISGFFFLVPWNVLSEIFTLFANCSWPGWRCYFSLYVLLGLAALGVSAVLAASLLGSMLVSGGHRRQSPATRYACAVLFVLCQCAGMLCINSMYWKTNWYDIVLWTDILGPLPLLGPLLLVSLVAVLLRLALDAVGAKSMLAAATALLPLLAGALPVLILLPVNTFSDADIEPQGSAMWAASVGCLITPAAAPDPACLLENPRWYRFNPSSQNANRYPDVFSYYQSYAVPEPFKRPLGYLWATLLRLAVLVVLNLLGFEAARLSVAQWRQEA